MYQGSSATTCTPSSLRYKNNINDSAAGLAELMQLRPVTFYFNDMGDPTEQVGFIAEEVFAVDPRLVQLDQAGLPDALRLDAFLPVMVKSIQELNLNLESIASTTALTTPKSESFAESFFSNLFSRMTTWLADAGNGIAQVFAKEVYTDKLCVKKSDGDNVCVTGDELAQLLAAGGSPPAPDPSLPTPTPTPPAPNPVPPTPEPEPEPGEVPPTDSEPIEGEPTPEPELELVPEPEPSHPDSNEDEVEDEPIEGEPTPGATAISDVVSVVEN
jgi:hypothetical protein